MPLSFLEGLNPVRSCSHPVADLLPHAPPIVLLDEVLGWDEGRVIAALTIRPESPFFMTNNGIPSYVGLEYMAQTCGVYAGIEALNLDQPVRLGFLLGTRNFHASTSWFCPGYRLVIEATEICRQETMGVFGCRITHDDVELASAQLNLYQPKDASSTFGHLSEG
jgi:predicted hotdog family 3-hydroxylacyl-ACP dehydratase